MDYICVGCLKESNTFTMTEEGPICGNCYQDEVREVDSALPTVSGTWFYPQKLTSTTISG